MKSGGKNISNGLKMAANFSANQVIKFRLFEDAYIRGILYIIDVVAILFVYFSQNYFSRKLANSF